MFPVSRDSLIDDLGDAPEQHVSGAVIDLSRDRVCFASGTTAHVVRCTGDHVEQECSLELPFTPDCLALARSSDMVMVRRADRRQIWTTDLRNATAVRLLEQHENERKRLVACIGSWRGQDLLVCSRRGSELEAFAPGVTTPLWTIDCETFRSGALIPVGDAVIALGRFAGETKDSLAVIDLELAESAPGSMFSRFREKTLINDYAYELAAGPAEGGKFVGYRNPEDDEAEPNPTHLLHQLHGLYVRTLDGQLVASFPHRSPPVSGHIAAGAQSIGPCLR